MNYKQFEPILSEEQKDEHLRMVRILFLGAATAYCLFGFVYLFSLGAFFLFIHNIFVTLFLYTAYTRLKVTKYPQFWINLGLLITSLAVIVLNISLGGDSSPKKYWSIAIIISAAFMSNLKSVVFWTVFSLFAFIFSSTLGELPLPKYQLTHEDFHLMEITTFAAIVFLSLYFIYSYHLFVSKVLGRTKEAENDLKKLIRTMGHDMANMIFSASLAIGMIEKNECRNIHCGSKLSIIRKSLKMMVELIEKVKSAEALKAGKIIIQEQILDPSELILKIKVIFEGRIDEKKLHFNLDNQLPAHIRIQADEAVLLHQVIGNLLSNAIKFSAVGSKLELKFYFLEESTQVGIEVRDYGIGIPKEMVSKLYSFHEKTARPGTLNERGTGFGMPIVKLFVERMKGTISFTTEDIDHSPDNHGTCFKVLLPGISTEKKSL